MGFSNPLAYSAVLALAGAIGAGAGGFACYCAFLYVTARGARSTWSRVRYLVSGAVLCFAYVALAVRCGLSARLFELGCFAAVLLFLSHTDLEMRTIPNECLVLAAVVRLVYLVCECFSGACDVFAIAGYLLGAAAVGAFLLLFTDVVSKLTGIDSMGGGDLKLYCVAAFYFGWAQGLVVIALSCFFVLVGAAVLALCGRGGGKLRGRTLPFGPSISAACLAMMLMT